MCALHLYSNSRAPKPAIHVPGSQTQMRQILHRRRRAVALRQRRDLARDDTTPTLRSKSSNVLFRDQRGHHRKSAQMLPKHFRYVLYGSLRHARTCSGATPSSVNAWQHRVRGWLNDASKSRAAAASDTQGQAHNGTIEPQPLLNLRCACRRCRRCPRCKRFRQNRVRPIKIH